METDNDKKDITISVLIKKNIELKKIISAKETIILDLKNSYNELEKQYKDNRAFINNLKSALKEYLATDTTQEK